MFEYKDFGAFKQHLRDFLVQVQGQCYMYCMLHAQTEPLGGPKLLALLLR
jgi:hypothetical protein